MTTHRLEGRGTGGRLRVPVGMSDKSTGGENIEQAEVLPELAGERWRKGGTCDKAQAGRGKD